MSKRDFSEVFTDEKVYAFVVKGEYVSLDDILRAIGGIDWRSSSADYSAAKLAAKETIQHLEEQGLVSCIDVDPSGDFKVWPLERANVVPHG